MTDFQTRISALDITMLDMVPSQTTEGDRRSFLAAQRATAKAFPNYHYLEIGSFRGGSIQPHLVDERCKTIYSIDPRPSSQPDDREEGYIAEYVDNTTATMLNLLRGIGAGDLGKITTFELDASDVNEQEIDPRPELVLIDGEHTNAAVLRDFEFCRRIVHERGTVLFHDFGIVEGAIVKICKSLRKEGREHTAIKLDGEVFGIFFDFQTVQNDEHLMFFLNKQQKYGRRERLKRLLPTPVVSLVQGVKRLLRGQPATN